MYSYTSPHHLYIYISTHTSPHHHLHSRMHAQSTERYRVGEYVRVVDGTNRIGETAEIVRDDSDQGQPFTLRSHAYMHTLMQTHMHTIIHTCTQSHRHVHMHVSTNTHARKQTHLQSHTCTQSHTHIHTITHTCTHVGFQGTPTIRRTSDSPICVSLRLCVRVCVCVCVC